MRQRADLTFKHNLDRGRHGWLRLTPAYSVKIVQNLLNRVGKPQFVLDPFSGTGTTGLVCAESGFSCDLVEINPFLVWLASAKMYHYNASELDTAFELARDVAAVARANTRIDNLWIPPLNHIERWWTTERLMILANLFYGLRNRHQKMGKTPAINLALIAFCKVVINWSNAAFNHQSMSFKENQPTLLQFDEKDLIIDDFLFHVQQITASARLPLSSRVTIHNGDARSINIIASRLYDCVITSPPYPNRMSYIREVRPYMYWLEFIKEAREAGELDWQAIGGTWGIATSWLAEWHPGNSLISYEGFEEMIGSIRDAKGTPQMAGEAPTAKRLRSPLLANYVHKYFCDIATHLANLRCVLASDAKIFYIVGNSKFYDTLVPVEQIYMSLLRQFGFRNVRSEVLRKRNSKKELYEFVVSAEWGGD